MARLPHCGRRLLLRRRVAPANTLSVNLRLPDPHPGLLGRIRPSALTGICLAILIAICLSAFTGVKTAGAQESPAAAQAETSSPPTRPPIVTDIDFRGNLVFPKESLELRVRSLANRELLGWTGIRWWLGLYRLGASGKLGKRLGGALMSAGEEPAYVDSSLVQADVERLRLYYQQEGYRDAHVEATIIPGGSPRHVSIVFDIAPGKPTHIRKVSFEGLDQLPEDAARRIAERSLIRHRREDVGDDLSFVAVRERYSESKLLEERRRILTALLDRGHASATRDSIRAIIFDTSRDSFDVRFRIRPGPRFKFGSVTFIVSGPESRDFVRRDTIDAVQVDSISRQFSVTSTIFSEGRLDLNLLRRSLQFEPGAWYNKSRLDATKRRLESSGVFSFSDVQPLLPDQQRTAFPVLPHQIELRTRQRHQVKLQLFFLQRAGLLGTTDRDFGAGVGVTFRNTNLLGEGEAFQFRASVSSSADRALEVLNPIEIFRASRQSEVEASINFPYLVRPFRRIEGLANFYDVRTRLSVSLLAARRDELRLIVRGRGSGRLRLELQHSRTVTSSFDILDLTISNPDTLEGFRRVFLDSVLAAVSDPVLRGQIVEDYTKPQVNNAFRYSLISSNANPLKRDRGHSYEGSFEVGGNLPALLDRTIFTPGVIEGSLPGLPFFGGSGETRLIYRPYLRFVIDLRQYRRVNRNFVFAWKALAGISHPTGKSDVVPFDKRFFSGGSFSVRGWGLGELGPGRARLSSTGSEAEANILGGDIKLEFSVELRQIMLRDIFAADWVLTPFVDAGNVWFGPRNPGFETSTGESDDGRFRGRDFVGDIGVGSGVGLRLAWEYFIARLDFAYKVHDPATGEFFPQRLDEPRLHFAIGHTF